MVYRIQPVANNSITFFDTSQLLIETIGRFLAYFLLIHHPRTTIFVNQLHLSQQTIVDWCSPYRMVHQK
ncbi:unnamed protein product [Acanthoscelides obtectus]|uniref:Uncharacterized protein n=1 Tax=Acanthoscelides obtectus TaxID=200917 RepID=A0A9P0LCT1_ACAOB|nr:unnamed protein product [Acanthoscelides obtectus]CAK1632931.1 hypothetical protein AOBTE_LOCUS7828 [Acanthoscelides obtectus]